MKIYTAKSTSATTHIPYAFQISKLSDLEDLWDTVTDYLRRKGYGDYNMRSHSLFAVSKQKINVASPTAKGNKIRLICVRLGSRSNDDEGDEDLTVELGDKLFYDDDDEELATIALLKNDLRETSFARAVAGSRLHHELLCATAVRTFISKNQTCFSMASLNDMTPVLKRNFIFSGTTSQKEQALADLVRSVSSAALENLPHSGVKAETVFKRLLFFACNSFINLQITGLLL